MGIRAQVQAGDTQIASDPAEALVIAQPLGEELSGAQVVDYTRLLVKRQQGIAQVEAQVDGVYQRVSRLGELRQGGQRLLKIRYGFAVRRADCHPGPGLPVVGHGLVPRLAPHGMVGQPFHLLGQTIRVEASSASTIRPCSIRRRSWSRPLYATSWVKACLKVKSRSGNSRVS